MANQNLKDVIKDRYGKIARGEQTFCCPSCGPTTTDQCLAVGYTAEDLSLVPELAILGVGCGNPTALADLQKWRNRPGPGLRRRDRRLPGGQKGRAARPGHRRGPDRGHGGPGTATGPGAWLRQRGVSPGRYRASPRGFGHRGRHHQQLRHQPDPGQTGELYRDPSGLEARRAHPDRRPGDRRRTAAGRAGQRRGLGRLPGRGHGQGGLPGNYPAAPVLPT